VCWDIKRIYRQEDYVSPDRECRKRICLRLPNIQNHWEIKVAHGKRKIGYGSLEERPLILLSNSKLQVELYMFIHYLPAMSFLGFLKDRE